MAVQLDIPLLGLVENMSYAICPKCGEQIEVFGPSQAMDTALGIGAPLIGRIPLDPELARLCDSGQIEEYRAEAFEDVAERVVALMPEKKAQPTVQ
jgi:hypothetical protein